MDLKDKIVGLALAALIALVGRWIMNNEIHIINYTYDFFIRLLGKC